ncbi:MAG: DUF2924 domain-containing protein [Rhodospirillaceae bacterium]|nr:DUF2924 domain-containing protein [Rhodospirillaceae bacterium]
MNLSVMAQVASLPDKPTSDLKRMWQDLFETKAPPYNRSFLIKRLSYRLQELAFGGLSKETQIRLDALADDATCANSRKSKRKAEFRPISGTRLIREWQGIEHQVTVLDDGFEYQGCKYKSLSVIARTITGTRWSGPVFFGIKKQGNGT